MPATPCVFCKKNHETNLEEALHLMRKTPDTLRELLDGVSMEGFSKSKAGEWSPRQVLIHLIDCEFIFGFRFRFLMAEKEPRLNVIDQNLWSGSFQYGLLDAEQLVRGFTPLRRVNLELLQSVDPAFFDKTGHHPEFGAITVRQMIPHVAAHDLNHLQQIRERIPAA